MVSSLSSRLLGFSGSGSGSGSDSGSGSGSSSGPATSTSTSTSTSPSNVDLAMSLAPLQQLLPRSTYCRTYQSAIRPARDPCNGGSRYSHADQEDNIRPVISVQATPVIHPRSTEGLANSYSSSKSSSFSSSSSSSSTSGEREVKKITTTSKSKETLGHSLPKKGALSSSSSSSLLLSSSSSSRLESAAPDPSSAGTSKDDKMSHDDKEEQRAKKQKATAEVQYALSTIKEDLERAGMSYEPLGLRAGKGNGESEAKGEHRRGRERATVTKPARPLLLFPGASSVHLSTSASQRPFLSPAVIDRSRVRHVVVGSSRSCPSSERAGGMWDDDDDDDDDYWCRASGAGTKAEHASATTAVMTKRREGPASPLAESVLSTRRAGDKFDGVGGGEGKVDGYHDRFRWYADLVSFSRPFYGKSGACGGVPEEGKAASSPRALSSCLAHSSSTSTASTTKLSPDPTFRPSRALASDDDDGDDVGIADCDTGASLSPEAAAAAEAAAASTGSLSSISDTESDGDGSNASGNGESGERQDSSLLPRLEEAIEAATAAVGAGCGGGLKGHKSCGQASRAFGGGLLPVTDFSPIAAERRKRKAEIMCPKSASISLEEALSYSSEPRFLTQAKYPFLLVHCNAAFFRLTGLDTCSVIGRPLKEVLVSSRMRGLSLPSCAAMCASGSGGRAIPVYATFSSSSAAAASDDGGSEDSTTRLCRRRRRPCRLSVLPVLADAETHECGSYSMTFSVQIPRGSSTVAMQNGTTDDGTRSVTHFSLSVVPSGSGEDGDGDGTRRKRRRTDADGRGHGEVGSHACWGAGRGDDLSDWEQDSVEERDESPDETPVVVVG